MTPNEIFSTYQWFGKEHKKQYIDKSLSERHTLTNQRHSTQERRTHIPPHNISTTEYFFYLQHEHEATFAPLDPSPQ